MRFQLRRPLHFGADPPLPTSIAAGRSRTPPPVAIRGQATGADARAERMLRRIREEMEELRESMDLISAGQDALLQVSPAAVAANPAVAETLSPRVLVRALVTAAATEEELRARLASSETELAELRRELAQLREEHARVNGRDETLEHVIAALHANLEDLRSHRRYLAEAAELPRLGKGRKRG